MRSSTVFMFRLFKSSKCLEVVERTLLRDAFRRGMGYLQYIMCFLKLKLMFGFVFISSLFIILPYASSLFAHVCR